MSYFDEASLVLVPSGYKNQKIYSIKPLDGAGDLAFTRASSATRVASNGLIEKVRTNLALYSNDFSNAAWAKLANVSVSGTRVADPFGGNTAWQVIFDGTPNGRLEQTVGGATLGASYTFSVWLRVASGTQSVAIGGGATESTITVTTTWQRFSSTSAAGFTDVYPRFRCDSAVTVQAYGAQIELSDFGATDYIATTSAAVSVGPVSGLPRLDYLNSSCPRLLLEPQRTNSALYSEQFDNAYWRNNGLVSVVANNLTSPDGTSSGDFISEVAINNVHYLDTTAGFAVTNGVTYTFSVFAKFGGRFFSLATNASGFGGSIGGVFNLQNGTVFSTIGGTASIENYGNGWYRCIVTGTSTSTTSTNINLGLSTNGTLYPSYLGDITKGVYLWGAQIEAGAYGTSYIPTLGTSVTRVADFANKGSISSLFGATEGTFFCELTYSDSTSIPIFLQSSVSSSFNQATFLQMGGNKVTYNVYSGGSQQVGITSTSNFTEGQNLKIAIVYKANDFAMYINGVDEGVDTSGSISSSLTAIQIGRWDDGGSTFQYFGRLRQAILFPTRLSNSDLAALTA